MSLNQLSLLNNTSGSITYSSIGVTVPATPGTATITFSQAAILLGDSAFLIDIQANNISVSDGVYTYANTAATSFLYSSVISLTGTTFTPVTGSASVLNGVVFNVDSTGYTTAYVTITVSPSGGGSNNVTVAFEASPDGIRWFQVPQIPLSSGQIYNQAVGQSILLVSSGSVADPQAFKVRVAGRFLRLRIDFMDTPGSTITATAYMVSADSQDTVGLVNAQLVDFFGNSPVIGAGQNINSLCTTQATDQRYATSQDTFTTTGAGAVQGNPTTNPDTGSTATQFFTPMRSFTIQVVPTGAVTSWTVVLEGSLDGTNFDTILTHTNISPGSGKMVVSGASMFPVFYIRSRCSALTLGSGTNVVANILGVQ